LETLWTVERQMDILSQKLGIDPDEFRMKNILRPGATTVTGERMTRSTSCPADCLSAVVREIGWTGRKSEEDREWETGKVRGKGFAMIQKAPAMPPNTATSVIMQMAGDGHVKIMIGAVDIEVDVESGAITVLKVASAFDLGQVINERMVYGQVVGGVMQGIGSAILEGYKFNDDNVLLNPSFTDNKIPTMKDMPLEVVPIYIENPQLNGPYGARGVAEHTMISIPSAIGNALYDALGINFYHLPLTPENVALGIASGKKDIQ
ncbi:MAG: xanthine dehydrogenase family protein molybdopterin-binding subunit, partial [Clostridiaceae bacterium]|nr:xanthine dehydrogenase family protein molybdopterin-binding subunit [Clostridiaceae bacterium]